jgi:hypothetical protein
MGHKEWLDQEGAWAFIPAFVNPYDEGVLKVFDQAKRVLRTIGDPGDAFDGYQRSDGAYVSKQIQSIFQTLRDDSIGITYISPPGGPVYDAAKRPCGQVIRTHAEVVERKAGTCHDLALLFAACSEYVRIRPLVLLAPGHTYFGYWTGVPSHERFWTRSERRLRAPEFGASWTITDGPEVLALVENGDVRVVETTLACERGETFERACAKGLERLKGDSEGSFQVALDVYAARGEVQPV